MSQVARGGPLVPAGLRPWLLVLVGAAGAILAGFGAAVWHSDHPVLFDGRADSFFMGASGFAHHAALVLSRAGDPGVFVTITAAVALVMVALGDVAAAVTAVGSVAASVVLVEEVFKPLFDRHLDELSGPSFPSGHIAVSMALAGAVVLAAHRGRPLGRALGPALRSLLKVGVVAVACAIGLAMVSLHLHYLSDAMVGAPLGLAVTGTVALSVDAAAARWQRAATRRDAGVWPGQPTGEALPGPAEGGGPQP